MFTGLDDMPAGTLLWRGMLNWFGGLGIVIVALGFLPAMKVGGMQIFKSESFETFGKILPRAGEIAASMSWVYVALTAICAACYAAFGQSPFDSIVHAMTTISTGGFANYDSSFGELGAAAEYIAAFFMAVASMPFVLLVQFASGNPKPLWKNEQVRGFLAGGGIFVVSLVAFLVLTDQSDTLEHSFRKALFNTSSIMTGCGYSSEDYDNWGPFAVAVFFLMGLIGGCAGSTCCSVKVFRYQIVFAAITAQIKRIHSPHGVFLPRYQGRPVDDDHFGAAFPFRFGSMDEEVVATEAGRFEKRLRKDPTGYFVVGDETTILDRIRAYVDAGASKFILRPIAGSDADLMDQTRKFIDLVQPELDAIPLPKAA